MNSSREISEALRVTVCEMTSNADWGSNRRQVIEKLEAITLPTDFVSFPENALYLRLNDDEEFEGLDLNSSLLDPIQEFAKKNSYLIHLGSVPIKEKNGTHSNATVLLFPDGARQVVYRKMHLFDVEIAGHRSYRESDIYSHGSGPGVFEWKGWKFGASICYDLRFSELYQAYARRNVDVILIPSAFTVPTGRAHWSVLIRARAIESQVYVLAAAQQGRHSDKRETYGHSMIVDPWGEVLGEAKPGEALYSTLTKSKIASVRSQIPMGTHRHPATKFGLN